MKQPNWIEQADHALKRAAWRAQRLAASSHTPLHYIKDGEVTCIIPTEAIYPEVPDKDLGIRVAEDNPS
jgi:hypothetical protein